MWRDKIAVKRFVELRDQHKFNLCIETGTWYGNGAIHLSCICPQIITIEKNPKDLVYTFNGKSMTIEQTITGDGFKKAEENLKEERFVPIVSKDSSQVWVKENRSIVTIEGSSPDKLTWLFNTFTIPRPICFLLDAHGPGYWPLLDEIKAIETAGLSDSVIIIHDFYIPGTGWGFDTWNGQRLDIDYVREPLLKVNPKYEFVYNDTCDIIPDAIQGNVGILFVIPPLS